MLILFENILQVFVSLWDVCASTDLWKVSGVFVGQMGEVNSSVKPDVHL